MTRRAPSSLASRLLWLPLVLSCTAGACADRGDTPGDGFSLVAQALRARSRLVFTARQDIVWITTAGAQGGGMVQIVADIAQSGRRARMTYRFPPEAAGRVMADDGVRASLYDPARRTLLVGQTQAEDAQTAAAVPALLRRNYRCLRLRRESVNGCPCDVVALQPRTGPGCSKTVWIDRAHRAILRAEEYDCDGNRRYVSSYETISFARRLPPGGLGLPPLAGGAARREIAVQHFAAASAPRAFDQAGVPGRLPAWLPRGYVLLRCAVVRAGRGGPSVLLGYGDGLKTLTVFEQTSGQPPASGRGLARWGQQAWTRRDGRVSAIVRGDLALAPALGAEMISALAPTASPSLLRATGQDFGPEAANLAVGLHRRGWGFEQIGALCLFQKERPESRKRVRALLAQGRPWPQIAAGTGADADALESQARAWVASSLAAGHGNEGKKR